MAIGYTVKGDWKDTFNYLNKIKDVDFKITAALNEAGEKGCEALRKAAPKETGLMASQWGYTIEQSRDGFTITWHNYDIEGGYNVAILIQYGHGTGTGGYVASYDFINPAMAPIFDEIAEEVWKEITK